MVVMTCYSTNAYKYLNGSIPREMAVAFQGEALVKAARTVITTYLRDGVKLSPQHFNTLQNPIVGGVFCTLNKFLPDRRRGSTDERLRGCIGRVGKPMPLVPSLIDSAIDAAINDPRFPPVRPTELNNIVIEVSILTLPEEIRVKHPTEYLNHIEIGIHGLIVELGPNRGLLLPQVATEHQWDPRTFLEMTCWKAFLPRNAWKDPRCKVWRFSAEIWEEVEPNGTIVLKTLRKE